MNNNDWDLVIPVEHEHNEIKVSRSFILKLKKMNLSQAKKIIKPYIKRQGTEYIYKLEDNQKEDVIISKKTQVYNDFSVYNALK